MLYYLLDFIFFNRISEQYSIKMSCHPALLETAKRELEERMESLELELKERQREFEEKESELNWVYQQKLEQASGETAEKVEILRVQEERMTRLQVELVEAIQRGEEKDLEIYRKGDEIR